LEFLGEHGVPVGGISKLKVLTSAVQPLLNYIHLVDLFPRYRIE
jgi:hypothetical protein